MRTQPLIALDLFDLQLQGAQAHLGGFLKDPIYARQLIHDGLAYSGFVDDRIIGCCGIIPMWPGRGLAWALLSPHAKHHFLAITRAVTEFLDRVTDEFHRIDTAVDADFEPGHRWAKMLGFEYEGLMKAYTPAKKDNALYARVRL